MSRNYDYEDRRSYEEDLMEQIENEEYISSIRKEEEMEVWFNVVNQI